MDRREFIHKTGKAAIAASLAPWISNKLGYKQKKRPNLIYVFSDQHRRQALGFMNEDPVYTPHLDQFARQGMVMDNTISNAPVCTPYRAMLLTGRYPLSTGMTTNCSPNNPGLQLSPDEVSIGNVLKNAGYKTGYIGKWHLDDPTDRDMVLNYDPDNGRGWDTYTPPGPERQGFDYWHAYNAYGDHAHPHYWNNNSQMIQVDDWSPHHEVNKAMDFIKGRKKDQPFALFMSHLPPHPRYQPPEKYKQIYDYLDPKDLITRKNVDLNSKSGKRALEKIKGYFAAISGIDKQFGRLMAFLDKENLTENTIVVFSADHGEMMGSHGRFNKNIYYEEAIDIPFIIRWPGHIKPGHNDMIMGVPDIMPTLLGLMDIKIPGVVEGKNYARKLCTGRAGGSQSTFLAHYPANTKQKRKLKAMGKDWRQLGWRGIRNQRYTYVVDHGNDGKELQRLLFDEVNDPWQMNPTIVNGPVKGSLMKSLNEQLSDWMRVTHDSFNV